MAAAAARFLVRVAALAAAVASAGCKSDDDQPAEALTREGDAALVVVVDRAAGGVELVDEEEPNDDLETAQPLPIPGGVRGTLDGEEDFDHVRLEIEESLQLSALVTGAEDVDLILDVLDEDGERIVRSDRAPVGYSEGVPNLALEPGTYYLVVFEFVRGRERGGEGARRGPSEPYELVVRRHEPETGYEVEPNDDLDDAGEVELDRDAFGYIGWHGDTDVWRIPLAGVLETDGLDIAISGVPWVAPRVEIVDEEGAVLLRREGRRGEPLYVHNLAPHHALGETGAGADALYLRLASARSNPEEPYRLRVSRRDLEPDSELEPNHEPNLATPLREGVEQVEGERRGHLDLDDTDTYRLSASPGPRVLHATVEPTSGVRARLEVLVDGEVIGEAEEQGRGASATVAGVDIPAGRSATLVVGGDTADPAGGSYRLRWAIH